MTSLTMNLFWHKQNTEQISIISESVKQLCADIGFLSHWKCY